MRSRLVLVFIPVKMLYICSVKLDANKIETIKRYFETRPVLKAYVFGSYARNEADYQSDIDILVDLDYSQRIGLQFIQMKIDLEKLLNTKVDLVSSNGLSQYIRPLVDKEKQLIYAR
jgi:uncharacterized protein